MILVWSRNHPIYGAYKHVPVLTMYVRDQGKTYGGALCDAMTATPTAFMQDERYDLYMTLKKIVRTRLENVCKAKARS